MDPRRDEGDERVRGSWSPEEDAMLRRLVDLHGARNWTQISAGIPGRSGKSCRLRWCNQLSPDVHHQPFTMEEDKIIVSLTRRTVTSGPRLRGCCQAEQTTPSRITELDSPAVPQHRLRYGIGTSRVCSGGKHRFGVGVGALWSRGSTSRNRLGRASVGVWR
ncbi:hypothetical protein HPP92_013329 [Vanilla planifolia]|uniref:Uncharacterized protein n=1 Tax=Vanilla planifolia TaxID=51239 RepID=A0A835QS30_VANPL|nr:hypothetical protein HPP92_013329 [Vanilla planifolia]